MRKVYPTHDNVGAYKKQVQVVSIIEVVIWALYLILVIWLGTVIGPFPGGFILFFVVGFGLYAAQIFWLHYANQHGSIHQLIAWYVVHAVFFTLTSTGFMLRLFAGQMDAVTLIVMVVFAVYRVYSIHVVRCRACTLLKQLQSSNVV